MKVHSEAEMTPGEAGPVMGLPDAKSLNDAVVGELRQPMTATLAANDPAAMMQAPMAFGGFDRFHRLWRESAAKGGEKG